MGALVTSLVVGHGGVAQASAEPFDITQRLIGAQLHRDHGVVYGNKDVNSPGRSSIKSHHATTLTAFQPICQQSVHDDLAAADVCHRAGSLCPLPDAKHILTPVWIMQAPSPRPGPEDWVRTGHTCVSSAKAQPPVVVTEADFRRLPIPAPGIVTQPPDRVTLINIDTNFLTVEHLVVLPAVVLGQRVRVRATPAQYRWTYGDGQGLTTHDPGHRYPYMPTAHTYTTPGKFTVTLATTFTGEFSVAGGPWQPIIGTATISSRPVMIEAQERRAVLIS